MIVLTQGDTLSRLFGLDWQLLADAVLTLIAVFVLFLAMSYFLFNPARKMLRERREKIKGQLDSARDDKEQAAKLKQEYEEKLRGLDREAEAILSESRRKALENEAEIVAGAKEEARRILERARTEAELERRKMADEVKKEMITLASAMAGKMVSVSLDEKVQEKLVDETLKEIGDDTWLS